MDTAFPVSEEQAAQQDQDLAKYAGEVAPPPQPAAAPAPQPAPETDENATSVLIDTNKTGVDRTFKGHGAGDVLPPSSHVQTLRENQKDPIAAKAFDKLYGAGASQRYLNYPSAGDVKTLLANKDDPQAVEAFNRYYGDVAKLIVPLYDPKTPAYEKQLAAVRLNAIYTSGRNWVDSMRESSLYEGLASIGHGTEAAIKETLRSVVSGADYLAGTKAADAIPSSADTRLTNHPIVNSIVSGVTQFVTARAAMAPVGAGAQLGKLGLTIREMGIDAFINAFSFNPNDPLLGDVAKQLGMGDNWFTKLDSIETYKEQWQKRLARAGEGAAFGVAIDTIATAWRAVKAYRAGDIKGAEAAKNELADIVQKQEEQLKLPLREPEHQPSLPLGPADKPPGNTPAPEFVPKAWGEGVSPPQVVDKWGKAHQLELDLGKPVEGPFTHGRTPGSQGDLFDMPNAAVKGEAKAAETAAPFVPDAPPKSYSHAEIASTPRSQFIKDALEENPPIVRETKAAIDSVDQPARLPRSVQDILDRVPDFERFDLASIRSYTAPVFNDFLKLAQNTPEQLDRAMFAMANTDPNNLMKLQALVSKAMAQAERTAVKVGAELENFKRAAVTDAKEIARLEAQVKEANGFIADLQKVDLPMSSIAGRLLQQRQIEARLTAARRVDVADLRSKGVSEERINELIRTATDNILDHSRLADLNQARLVAHTKGDVKLVEKLDRDIAAEMEKALARADSKLINYHHMIVSDIASFTINNILSGFGTIYRNVAGAVIHNGVFKANRKLGNITTLGREGFEANAIEAASRNIALRTGHQSTMEMIQKVLSDAASAAVKNEGSITSMGHTRRISGAKYGLDGVSGKAIDVFGRGSEMLTMPLRMSDEVLGTIFQKHAIGSRAGFEFAANLRSQREIVKAKLRDPNLTAGERKAFQEQLDKLGDWRSAVIEIDGKPMNHRQYVESRLKQSYDSEGKLTNLDAASEADYILLRNKQTATLGGAGLEKIVNSTPYLRFVIPVFNAPMNGFKRGLEMMPGLRNRFLTDLRNELDSTDPYIRAMAHGKWYTGYAITTTALALAMAGVITKGAPLGRGERLSGQASSKPGPTMLNILGTQWDISGLDPITVPFVWAATFVDALHKYNEALEQKDNILLEKGVPLSMMEKRLEQLGNAGSAIIGATAAAFMQNPAVSGLKDVVELFTNMTKASEEPGAGSSEAMKMARGQLGKLIPNAAKQFAGLFDSNRYDPQTFGDVFNAGAGFTDKAPMLYDALGRPIQNKTPLRSLLGPLAPVKTPSTADKGQYVIDTLDNFGQLTGKYYTFNHKPPDALLSKYGIDLRTLESNVSGRKVIDTFASELRSTTIRGYSLESVLYAVLTDTVKKDMPLGNRVEKGNVFGVIDSVFSEYKEQAWKTALRKEEAKGNPALTRAINEAKAMQGAARNPIFDLPKQDHQSRTKEILSLFPR